MLPYFISFTILGGQIAPRFGKCGHSESSFRTTEKLTVVSGGINKETTNPQLSPHFRLHNTAASAAIYHTSFFLIDKRKAKDFLMFFKYFYSKCCCRYRALNYNYLFSISRKRHYKRYRTAETRITSWTYKRGNVGFHHRHFSGNVDRSRGLRQVHTICSEITKHCQLQVCVGDSRKRW